VNRLISVAKRRRVLGKLCEKRVPPHHLAGSGREIADRDLLIRVLRAARCVFGDPSFCHCEAADIGLQTASRTAPAGSPSDNDRRMAPLAGAAVCAAIEPPIGEDRRPTPVPSRATTE